MNFFKGQLSLLKRGQGYEGPQSHYVIAAWHWRWSITWSWLLWWWPKPSILPAFKYRKRPNELDRGVSITFAWFFGVLYFSSQKTMEKTGR